MSTTLKYAISEIPEDVAYTYFDATGAPINLTGFAVQGVFTDEEGAETSRAGTLVSGPNGQVSWSWTDGDLDTKGQYRLVLWVTLGGGSPTARYASQPITILVEDQGSNS
jgi:hypothetical protein